MSCLGSHILQHGFFSIIMTAKGSRKVRALPTLGRGSAVYAGTGCRLSVARECPGLAFLMHHEVQPCLTVGLGFSELFPDGKKKTQILTQKSALDGTCADSLEKSMPQLL